MTKLQLLTFFLFQSDHVYLLRRCRRLQGASDHPQDTLTLGRTLQDEGSDRLRDLYLTTHNTDKEETAMSPSGFEPAIPGR